MLLPLEVPELYAFFDVPVGEFFLGAFFARGLGDVGGVDGGDSAEVGLRGGDVFRFGVDNIAGFVDSSMEAPGDRKGVGMVSGGCPGVADSTFSGRIWGRIVSTQDTVGTTRQIAGISGVDVPVAR